MTRLQNILAATGSVACLAALFAPFARNGAADDGIFSFFTAVLFALLGVFAAVRFVSDALCRRWPLWADGVLAVVGAVVLLSVLDNIGGGLWGYWFLLAAAWLFAWLFVARLIDIGDKRGNKKAKISPPLMFGVSLLVIWEIITRGAEVPTVLLPPPSAVGVRIAASAMILWADFKQTFLKAALFGYVLGCGSGFAVAVAVDRSDFLRRGMLPLGNFVSALPIIGIAPIMVMWFGFDWQSKAAVVIVMTFFPMLVNTVEGLATASGMARDVMRTYAANYWQTLFKLRLPAAMPFIFNALKINSTLALIGAIVAEFFGTPIVGMGFRISTEVGRMNIDMVWAEIAMAALVGSIFYGVIVLMERMVTFWHPSVRQG